MHILFYFIAHFTHFILILFYFIFFHIFFILLLPKFIYILLCYVSFFILFFCTVHWADLSWPTFHYWLYPVWLCMWQIIKNLEHFEHTLGRISLLLGPLFSSPISVQSEQQPSFDELFNLSIWCTASTCISLHWLKKKREISRNTIDQWCQTQFLEGLSSAQFSSNQLQLTPAWKFLVILKTLISWIRCVWLWLELNSSTMSADSQL